MESSEEKKKKKTEENSEPVTNLDQSKEVVANCDQLVKVDANCNHPEQAEVALSQHDIEKLIITVRGEQVLIDQDIARLYGVTTKRLNQQANRNSATSCFSTIYKFGRRVYRITGSWL